MTDLLTEVIEDFRVQLVALSIAPERVAHITVGLEEKHRRLSGGDKHYICKVPDRAARRRQMAERVAAGERVSVVARDCGVSTHTVYEAVKAYPEAFSGASGILQQRVVD